VKALIRDRLQLAGVSKVKKLPKQSWAFVYFHSKREREAGEQTLRATKFKGALLTVAQATPLDPERFVKRRKLSGGGATSGEAAASSNGGGGSEGGDGSGSAPFAPLRSVSEVVSPLYLVDYEKQLRHKRRHILKALAVLPREMARAAKGVTREQQSAFKMPWTDAAWLREHEGAPCSVASVLPSPLLSRYRNKCEFTIGRDADGGVCIGFNLGKGKEGMHVVASPQPVPTVSDEMKLAVARAQAFVAASKLAPFHRDSASGFWRLLLVRQSFNNVDGSPPSLLLCVVVQVAEEGLPRTRVELDGLAAAFSSSPLELPVSLRLCAAFCNGRGETIIDGSSCGSLVSLIGEPLIYERLNELTFRISPAAFFQVNTRAAEGLTKLLASLCAVSSETVLLDVCCGGGTIGLTLASAVKRVVGIEVCAAAVEDARVNASLNGISNASFIADKAEFALRSVLSSLTASEKEALVAIVDPPRAGLHADVLKALRGCLPLRRLIYVSCHAPAFAQNAVALCRPSSKTFPGPPFVPRLAHPVDLFPHTEHVELVVLLERDEAMPAAAVEA